MDLEEPPSHFGMEAVPSFGIDAPAVVLFFAVLSFVLAILGIFVGSATTLGWGTPFWIGALSGAATAIAMTRSSVKGKRRLWGEILDGLGLRGDEVALDVGCGRGLVLVTLARRLPQGRVTGIDLWRGKDQSGNSRIATEHNAGLAGVADRVEVRDGDMTALPFPDASFDLVTASLAVHNVGSSEGRSAALAEMARVLRPGGTVAIVDIAHTGTYAAQLARLGLVGVQRGPRRWLTYPLSHVVTAARAPGGDGAPPA